MPDEGCFCIGENVCDIAFMGLVSKVELENVLWGERRELHLLSSGTKIYPLRTNVI